MIRRIAFAAALGLAISSAAPARAQDKVRQGSALFSSQRCVMCHSIAGKGNKKGALDGVGHKLKVDDIRQWLTNPEAMREKSKATRLPVMKDPKLSSEQLEALVAFLQAQKTVNADDER